MQCKGCSISKLSNEFPKSRLSPDCKHRPTWCARCVISTGNQACPECNTDIDDELYESLCAQFLTITQRDHFAPPPKPVAPSIFTPAETVTCTVSLMGGDSHQYTVTTSVTVQVFKQDLERRFRVPVANQRLMHAGQELKLYLRDRQATLQDFGITHGSTLQLMRLLLSVTQDTPYNSINFVLLWAKNYGRRAFMDGSCFVYQGRNHAATVDFKNPRAITGIAHSGPAGNRTYHVITVDLNAINGRYTHLFFVMSACHVATLAEFNSPTVSLYDTAHPSVQLSTYSISAQGDSQAVIMCCMKRTEHGGWQAFTLGRQSSGYCYNYTPIENTIAYLFNSRVID